MRHRRVAGDDEIEARHRRRRIQKRMAADVIFGRESRRPETAADSPIIAARHSRFAARRAARRGRRQAAPDP